MVEGYEQAIGRALLLQPPNVHLPAHLRPDVLRHTRDVIGEFLADSPI